MSTLETLLLIYIVGALLWVPARLWALFAWPLHCIVSDAKRWSDDDITFLQFCKRSFEVEISVPFSISWPLLALVGTLAWLYHGIMFGLVRAWIPVLKHYKQLAYGAVFGATMLLLGFQAAIELGGSFLVTVLYTITIGGVCLVLGWRMGMQVQKTTPFWIGCICTTLPFGTVVYAYPKEVQFILTIAWALAVLTVLALVLWKARHQRTLQQPTG